MEVNLIGATGLVGSALLQQLLADDRFARIRVFVRRPLHLQHPRLEVCVINFNEPEAWRHLVQGHALYSALGTTLRQAGSKEAQYQVDYHYPYAFAAAAAANGVPVYVLVSSVGAAAGSPNFYARMKGELDEAVARLSIPRVVILRPGVLAGERAQKRLAESLSIWLLSWVSRLPGLRAWRPIPGATVARAMLRSSLNTQPGRFIYTLGEVFDQADH
jgi:uncharacterized protein YbjT (DUF2867 family)